MNAKISEKWNKNSLHIIGEYNNGTENQKNQSSLQADSVNSAQLLD
ncbi:hypothetical protein [Lysinibacillus endophyticus]|nr:hypothetical protein [Lysinibacillus endophyticus]MCP1144611.1 hypothetical protein [Lysinibacillus endophyticus]